MEWRRPTGPGVQGKDTAAAMSRSRFGVEWRRPKGLVVQGTGTQTPVSGSWSL